MISSPLQKSMPLLYTTIPAHTPTALTGTRTRLPQSPSRLLWLNRYAFHLCSYLISRRLTGRPPGCRTRRNRPSPCLHFECCASARRPRSRKAQATRRPLRDSYRRATQGSTRPGSAEPCYTERYQAAVAVECCRRRTVPRILF
jgi:hypothetical protein